MDKIDLAGRMAKAGVFPTAEDEHKALAAIEVGESLGMKPAEALMAITFAQGKPSIDIHWQMGRLRRLGHDYEILEHDASHIKITFHRKEKGKVVRSHTIGGTYRQVQDIAIYDKEQGGKGAKLGNKWNWKAYTEDMLYAFWCRRGIRRFFPEVMGAFGPTAEEDAEEMGEIGLQEGEPVTQEKVKQNINDLFGDEAAEEIVNLETGEITFPRRDLLLKGLSELLDEHKIDRETFKAWVVKKYGKKGATELDRDTLFEVHELIRILGTEYDQPEIPANPEQVTLIGSEAQQIAQRAH